MEDDLGERSGENVDRERVSLWIFGEGRQWKSNNGWQGVNRSVKLDPYD